MPRWTLFGLIVLGVFLVVGVVAVAIFVPGDNITRGLAVLSFLVTLVTAGYSIWDKETERRKKAEAASGPIELKVQDAKFRFVGPDAGGGHSTTTKGNARCVSYWFQLNAFNNRAESLGLTDILLHFAKNGEVVHEQVPTEHVERSNPRYWHSEVVTLTLPKQEWFSVMFEGVGQESLLRVADCDEIYLTAKSTRGELFRVQLATSILEKS